MRSWVRSHDGGEPPSMVCYSVAGLWGHHRSSPPSRPVNSYDIQSPTAAPSSEMKSHTHQIIPYTGFFCDPAVRCGGVLILTMPLYSILDPTLGSADSTRSPATRHGNAMAPAPWRSSAHQQEPLKSKFKVKLMQKVQLCSSTQCHR